MSDQAVPVANALPVACFAPPLTDELLSLYRQMIAALPQSELKDVMQSCLNCVLAWWDLDVSTRTDGPTFAVSHRVDPSQDRKDLILRVTPLEDAHVQQLLEVTPWERELKAMTPLLDALPHGTAEVVEEDATTGAKVARCKVVDQAAHDLRNAAFHLLWHAMEITKDREPLTSDVLVG